MGPYNLTTFQIDTTLLTPSKIAVTELGARDKNNSITSIWLVQVKLEVAKFLLK